ncbi:hypothetical protein 2016_scaffold57_00130 [Bacteriophage sp.]|nr:hypothetical protein 2016_scaffold57_00130 [Bacteriophage sp.]
MLFLLSSSRHLLPVLFPGCLVSEGDTPHNLEPGQLRRLLQNRNEAADYSHASCFFSAFLFSYAVPRSSGGRVGVTLSIFIHSIGCQSSPPPLKSGTRCKCLFLP